MGLFGSLWRVIALCFPQFPKFLEKHLRELRPNVFKNLPSERIKEIIMYRFSHVGISDLFDHILNIQHILKGDSQNEGGDIESQAQDSDRNSCVSKEAHERDINRLETVIQSKNDQFKQYKETQEQEMIQLKSQVQTLLKKIE